MNQQKKPKLSFEKMIFFRIHSSIVFTSKNRCILLLSILLVGVIMLSYNFDKNKLMIMRNNNAKLSDNKVVNSSVKFGHVPGVEIQNGVCSKGPTPWDNEWIKSELVKFLKIYNTRPDNNKLGTPMMHQFSMWCIIRHLKPRHIIESGVWRGLGTWLLRQAAPDAQLIMLDPNTRPNMVYIDEQNDTLYFTNDKFRDFSSIRNWGDVHLDLNKTLAFIDDHNTPYKRIKHARRVGIKHIIFEDNYWLGFFDCLSLKQGCACLMDKPECKGFKFKDSYGTVKRDFIKEDFELISQTFEDIEIYKEFPMIWDVYKPGVKMVSEESTNYLYNTKDGNKLLKDLGLIWFPFPSQLNGQYTYANIAYVKLKY